ncbi:efflux RND transporter periplasmic adaptor subunit [Caballeronia sp. LZ034LL]|uniref:efflux RND transporter periplasmic adaptor subunit n=1 Tax=Caballeronia sp. LZ034LL TaxID=3038567 RepID=UPI00285F1E52|nr:efflux RND transporter periplasmic adaptor subunit [Caballeronia sp. LZ034LL]MDR5835120.1 efflux RND transporter periplasmic adaptor subunit [Caballeronia sp. LZ034LL]
MSTETSGQPQQHGLKKLRHLRLICILAVLVAAGVATEGIVSRMHANRALTSWTDAQAIPTVRVVTPQVPRRTDDVELPGRLDAYVNAPIYARVSGYLHAWYADIGTHVKAGQLLGQIDTPDLDQQLQQARADLANAIANEKLAATTARRWSQMLAQDSVSQQATDEKTSDLAAKQATVAASRANVARLEALESFKRITAPFDGVVTARKTDVGALINAGGGTGPELFAVTDAHKLRVYVNVPQSDAAAIRSGLTATLTVPERPGQTFQAHLVDSNDAISPQSGTMLVQLSVDNADGQLMPGEYAQVRFALPSDGHALLVPASALIFRTDHVQLAVLNAQNCVHLRDVKIATDLGSTVLIGSGLQQHDRVVDNPPDSLAEGDRVHRAVVRMAASEGKHA